MTSRAASHCACLLHAVILLLAKFFIFLSLGTIPYHAIVNYIHIAGHEQIYYFLLGVLQFISWMQLPGGRS